MDIVSFDTFLLLVLLILVGIVLFISLVTAIYVIRLSRRIIDQEKEEESAKKRRPIEPVSSRAITKEVTGAAVAPQEFPSPVKKVAERKFDISRDAPDIPTGMRNLCTIYGLNSLTVSSPDGLVIASSGHPSAVTEAAQFSYAFQTGAPIQEAGVHVFPVDFHATPLVGILRSPDAIWDSLSDSLQKDLLKLLEK